MTERKASMRQPRRGGIGKPGTAVPGGSGETEQVPEGRNHSALTPFNRSVRILCSLDFFRAALWGASDETTRTKKE